MSARVADEPMIALLAVGLTPTEVAEQLSLNVGTVYKRLRDPLFCARLQEKRGVAFSKLAAECPAHLRAALAELLDILTGTDPATGARYPVRDRRAAAKDLADIAQKVHDFGIVLPRVAALEALLAEHGVELPMQVREESP